MINISRHTLSNGLRIVHNRDTSTRFAVVNVLYEVGSRDENEELTGLAHLLEHLMFCGSENVPDFDGELQKAGGESNAWTSSDSTNYYDVLPIQNIETAFWLESDRMKSLAVSAESLEIQRSVVMEEFKQRCLNAPYGDLGHHLRKIAFDNQTYKWPVIGKQLSDIEKVTLEDVNSFRKSFYFPNNAILSVVGDIPFEKVVQLAEKWFGDIPSGDRMKSDYRIDKPMESTRFIKVDKNDVPQNTVVMAYRMGGRFDSDYYACDILSDILANGKSSRFFANVVSKGDTFVALDASIWGTLAPGLFIIIGRLNPGASYEDGVNVIKRELDKLISEKISKYEIQKYINKFESNDLFSSMGQTERAYRMAYFEMLGDANLINRDIENYYKLDAEKLQNVANNLFKTDNCVIMYYGV